MLHSELEQELLAYARPEKVSILQRFFKTGVGEYGENDVFIAVSVPNTRVVAKKYIHLGLEDLSPFLKHKIHEYRLTALHILVYQFQKAKKNLELQEAIYTFYHNHISWINNWDLVDTSADKIVGAYLWNKERDDLYELAQKEHLWSQRIAIVSTRYFVKQGDFEDALSLITLLLTHEHDLIHKANGWVLREIWEKDPERIEAFLEQHIRALPRTTLRYAIEKMTQEQRTYFLKL